ncbi:MAG: TonB-dependent receptor [Flavobacteriales bacterium]|nr:TonB-dependent receptor [Flavobacteriales bacterium]
MRTKGTAWGTGVGIRLLVWWSVLLPGTLLAQQYKIRGVVTDGSTGETIIGANVVLKGTTTGATTDINGRFEIGVNELPPYVLVVSFIGYQSEEIRVESLDKELRFKLSTDQVLMQEVEVVGSRISEKQKQAPLTVESMDVIAIREAPSGDFYESLGTLKGVDMTAASMGFKVINTRGFNSTSPVRSLQLIDGVDNQSPGLNFSLGNFLGASDLDVMKVDVIAGASTAYFGPGAFNGVINMTTKTPWLFPGLSVSVKGGERGLLEGAVRWAEVLKNRHGKKRFAYKFNIFTMRAEDWYAEDYSATINSPTGIDNPGRYDAVNSYGDENTTVNNDFSLTMQSRREYPGLGLFLRPGYREIDLVDYGTTNLKASASIYFFLTDSLKSKAPIVLYQTHNFSTGSTVYQGDNRYRLENIKFFQHQLGVGQEGTWFARAYVTHEDAGDTYDIFTTGVRLQEASGTTREWNIRYFTLWQNWIGTSSNPNGLLNTTQPDFLTIAEAQAAGINTAEAYDAYLTDFVNENNELFMQYHQMVMDSVNSLNTTLLDPAYVVGTDRFNEKLDEIRGKRFTDGGSLFFDRSALYHGMGEYRFKPKFAEVVTGGSVRLYRPNSAGTIFRDTGDVKIKNWEYGVYAGLEKPFLDNKLKTTATLRMDKNQNFKHLFSPALSAVWTPSPEHVVRLSFSSAIRNPTLADQYLYYNVGRAILLGNIDGQFEEGQDSLITIESFNAYRSTPSLQTGLSKLEYFNVDRIRPEQVRTLEAGYRGTIKEKFFLDLGAYHSWYTDFIGYVIGISAIFENALPRNLQVYRVATNSSSVVRTQGFNIGGNYYRKRTTYSLNYSWNQLVAGSDDPIIPAFNTPENKFNIGITGHDMRIPWTDKQNLGFGVNYKFIEGFLFEGSPQFTGSIPTYDMVDAQVNVKFPKANTTVKVGCSNLFGIVPLFDQDVPSDEKLERMWNNSVLMVYGGPFVGRLAYLQLIYELDRR